MDGFSVDLAALTAAGDGITELVDTLDRLKVDDIRCDRSAVGHGGLADTLESFGDRWQIGVTNLVEDGRAMAGRLRESAEAYRADEQAASEAFGGGSDA